MDQRPPIIAATSPPCRIASEQHPSPPVTQQSTSVLPGDHVTTEVLLAQQGDKHSFHSNSKLHPPPPTAVASLQWLQGVQSSSCLQWWTPGQHSHHFLPLTAQTRCQDIACPSQEGIWTVTGQPRRFYTREADLCLESAAWGECTLVMHYETAVNWTAFRWIAHL